MPTTPTGPDLQLATGPAAPDAVHGTPSTILVGCDEDYITITHGDIIGLTPSPPSSRRAPVPDASPSSSI
jgi:hypothetical protein